MVMEKLNGFLLLKIFIIYYLLLFWEGLVGKRCDISKCLDRIFIMQIGKLCNLLMFKHINWWNRVINSNIWQPTARDQIRINLNLMQSSTCLLRIYRTQFNRLTQSYLFELIAIAFLIPICLTLRHQFISCQTLFKYANLQQIQHLDINLFISWQTASSWASTNPRDLICNPPQKILNFNSTFSRW